MSNNYDNQLFGVDNETDNVDDLRNAAIAVTACIVCLMVVLYSIKFFCCRSASYASRDDGDMDLSMADIAAAISQSEPAKSRIPFSSRIRRMYLEAALTHEIFHEHDVEKGGIPQKPNGLTTQSSIRTMYSSDDVIVVKAEAFVPEQSDRKDAVIVTCITDEVGSFSDEEDDVSMTHCAICYEALHEGDEITTSNCNKTFHRHCIMEWLMQHDLCPYCRNPFKNICEESNTVNYLANMDCESSSDFESRNPFRLADVDVRTETR